MYNKFHQNSINKGFWDDCVNLNGEGLNPELVQSKIPEKLCLIHSEVSECLEEFRVGVLEESNLGTKPVGFPSELADVVIRCYDLAGSLGIDLGSAIERKHAYNLTRSYKHGKRI